MRSYERLLKFAPAGLAALALAGCGSAKPPRPAELISTGRPVTASGLPVNCREFDAFLKPGQGSKLLEHQLVGQADAFDNADGSHAILANELDVRNVATDNSESDRSLEVAYREPGNIRHFLRLTIRQGHDENLNLGRGFQATVSAEAFGSRGRLDADAQVCYRQPGDV